MKEREVFEYIESLSGLGIVPGLESVQELCRRLGNPQNSLKFIHVGGTNGKGSVCTFMASILKQAGYKIGRYISPTIFDYRERIQVNDRMITKEALCRLFEKAKAACDEMVQEGFQQPTAFEIETAVGFLYFVEKQCDLVILEVGMGGLLDATNMVENKEAVVLASISMDHMKFLGNTLAEIAAQKAGIMKQGCPVITIKQQPEAMAVLEAKAKELECPLTGVDCVNIRNIKYGLKKQHFDYLQYKKLEISLIGQYQIENAAVAVQAIEVLREKGYTISEDSIRKGLLNTKWPARFTLIGNKPVFVVDGAHNEDAAKRLAQSIDFYFTNKRIIYIMGVLRDKEYEKIIALTHKYADQIITVTTPDNPRALAALDLAKEIMKVHPAVTDAASIEEAVEIAKLLAGKDDVIIAFGSLSFMGKLMTIAGYKA